MPAHPSALIARVPPLRRQLRILDYYLTLDEERVQAVDFGRGDDPYKRMWTAERRQRVGVVLANPLHPGGMAALLRHGLGRLRRTLRPTTTR